MKRRAVSNAGWAAVLGAVVLPVADRVLGQEMMARYRYLQRAQWWPEERILDERDRAIPSLISAALETEAYRDLYREASVDLAAIRTAADLMCLPIVSKADLRQGFPQRTTRPTGQRTYDECSAGSTGEPFCVKEDGETAGWYRASFLQILSWAGWRLGEPHVLLGINPGRGRGRALKDRLLHCEYVTSFDLTEAAVDRTLNLIADRGIRFVFGYPMAVRELATRVVERNLDLDVAAVVTWGDNLDPSSRSSIESGLRTHVLDAYGCSEGMWIASQCGATDLYHVHSLDVVLELLDDDDRPVPPGTPGHVVVTRLHPGPSPLVRYRTGDLAVRAAVACPCGRGYETVAEVVGRSADTITTPSGNKLIVHFFTGILEHFPEIATFQVAKTASDCAEVRLTGAALSDSTTAAIHGALHEKAPDMTWRLVRVDQHPPTSAGKRRFVIDETASE